MIRLCLLSLMSTLALAVTAETASEPSMDLLQDGDAKGAGHGKGHGTGEGHGKRHGKGKSRGVGHGEELTIDLRQPLQMSPRMSARQLANMREHLQGIEAIVMALLIGDFEGVAQRARRMGNREGTRRMCQQFPGGGEGFMQMAMGFHDSADALAEAAQTHKAEAVIDALGQTLARCNACHSSYRQEIVQQP